MFFSSLKKHERHMACFAAGMLPQLKCLNRISRFAVLFAAIAQIDSAFADGVMVSWTPSPSSDVIGYWLYSIGLDGSGFNRVHVENTNIGEVIGLDPGKSYLIYATALDTAGFESAPSSVITYQVPQSSGEVHVPVPPSDTPPPTDSQPPTGTQPPPNVPKPVLTQQPPSSFRGFVGHSASFTVAATGQSLSYQWRFNGTAISGATSSTYSISSLQSGQAGLYDVVISNPGGSVTSSAVTLTVLNSVSLTNGSFESSFSGWTVTGDQLDVDGVGSDGSRAALFNSTRGAISQTVSTLAGQAYVLRFDVGAISFAKNEQRLSATITGKSTVGSQVTSVTSPGGGVTSWASQTIVFIADSTSTTIKFADVSPTPAVADALILILDHVRLTEAQ